MATRWFEDIAPGDTIRAAAPMEVTLDEVKAFAGRWDVQWLHLDEAAAGAGPFGGVIASGWHTLAITMRLITTAGFFGDNVMVGAAAEVKWLKPVWPGDSLDARAEILETSDVLRKPDYGGARVRVTTLNQHGEAVAVQTWQVLVPRRPQAGG